MNILSRFALALLSSIAASSFAQAATVVDPNLQLTAATVLHDGDFVGGQFTSDIDLLIRLHAIAMLDRVDQRLFEGESHAKAITHWPSVLLHQADDAFLNFARFRRIVRNPDIELCNVGHVIPGSGDREYGVPADLPAVAPSGRCPKRRCSTAEFGPRTGAKPLTAQPMPLPRCLSCRTACSTW